MVTVTLTHDLEISMEGNRRRGYMSYLLRLWTDSDDTQAGWRASLEDPITGGLKGFADPDTLFTFLRRQMSRESQNSNPKGGGIDSRRTSKQGS
jgi:hypothetical protein